MDYHILEQTKYVLRNFSYIENGIDFKKSITMDVAYCCSLQRDKKYNWLRYCLRLLMPLQCVSFVNELNKHRVIFTSWTNRRDYIELINAIQSEIPNSKSLLIHKVFKRKLKFPSFYYIKIFKEGFKCNASFSTKIYISFRLIDYVVACNTMIGELKKKTINKNCVYVPFNSSFGLENAITQYLNLIGIKTFHLCHGLHFSPNYRFFSVDAFNKELVTAKKILSWGQGFVDNDKKLYTHNYVHEVVGNPKYPMKSISTSFHKKSCIVFLARGQYDINNIKLLSILHEYSILFPIKITIKPHPTDNISKIKKYCETYNFIMIKDNRTIKEVIKDNNYGFAVSYETTAYFESMYYDLVCFRYAYEENESYGDFDDRFVTVEELTKQIEKYSTKDLNNLSSEVQFLLEYEIGMGINRYSQVLN